MLKNKSLLLAVKESRANKFLSPEESIAVLNALLTGYEYLETLDKIRNTTLYKNLLKQKINTLQKELEVQAINLNEIVDIDNEALFNYMEHKKELMKKIAVLKPELKGGLNHVLDEFFNDPELTIRRLGIEIIDRDI